jgi:Domain of unknown function (DUF4878)
LQINKKTVPKKLTRTGIKPYIWQPKTTTMKKNLINFFIATAVITLAVGCKGKDKTSNDPKAVLTSFFEKLSKKDLDGAAKLATKDSKGTLDMMKKAMDAAEKMGKMGDDAKKDDPTEEFRKMKIGEAKIDGDNATVSVSNPSKDDKSFDFPLKKEDGNWKVDFSMGTLMKMGMEQAGKEKNMFNDDDTKMPVENSNDSNAIPEKMNDTKDSINN